MYGNLAGQGPYGSVGAGLAQLTAAGAVSLLAPTDIVAETGQELTVDGLRIVFQNTPGAEAPAELCFYLPQHRALCMSGDRLAHAPQRLHPARREDPRRARLVEPHQRGDPPVRRRHRRRLLLAPLADVGQRRGRSDSSRASGTSTATSTTRRCAWRTTGTTPPRSPRCWSCPAGIAGSFAEPRLLRLGQPRRQGRLHLLPRLLRRATRPTLHQLPPVEGARKAVEYMGGADAVLARAPRRLREGRVPLGGAGRQLRRVRRPGRTRRRVSSRPTPSSSSATRPRTAPGETSTSRRRRSCATGSSRCRSRAAPRRTSSGRCRSRCSSSTLPYGSTARRRPIAPTFRPAVHGPRRALPPRGRERRPQLHEGRRGDRADGDDHADPRRDGRDCPAPGDGRRPKHGRLDQRSRAMPRR